MHRRIVEALQGVLNKYAEGKEQMDLFSVYVLRTNTNGFWRVCVIAEEGKEYFLPHIESIAVAIGRMYGEGLFTDRKGDRLVLS